MMLITIVPEYGIKLGRYHLTKIIRNYDDGDLKTVSLTSNSRSTV